MTGELAQIINLITHYNYGQIDRDLYINNSIYKSCNSLLFVGFKKKFFGGYKEVEIARSTTKWFQYLLDKKIERLMLVFRPDNSMELDHKFAGMVGGGGNWYIEAKNSNFSDFWKARWEVKSDEKDNDNRIWNTTYGLTAPKQKNFNHPQYDVKTQSEKLYKTLTKIADFASSHDNTRGWEKTFNSAKSALEDEIPSFEYYKDLVPVDSLPIENLILLNAASKSFVFGGMGTWNDIGWFKDEEVEKKYDEVSAELYRVMNESILAAVNGTRKRP